MSIVGKTLDGHVKVVLDDRDPVIDETIDAFRSGWSGALQSTLSVDTVTA
jgi:hypothetical protein